jgi:hypothetical protein
MAALPRPARLRVFLSHLAPSPVPTLLLGGSNSVDPATHRSYYPVPKVANGKPALLTFEPIS